MNEMLNRVSEERVSFKNANGDLVKVYSIEEIDYPKSLVILEDNGHSKMVSTVKLISQLSKKSTKTNRNRIVQAIEANKRFSQVNQKNPDALKKASKDLTKLERNLLAMLKKTHPLKDAPTLLQDLLLHAN